MSDPIAQSPVQEKTLTDDVRAEVRSPVETDLATEVDADLEARTIAAPTPESPPTFSVRVSVRLNDKATSGFSAMVRGKWARGSLVWVRESSNGDVASLLVSRVQRDGWQKVKVDGGGGIRNVNLRGAAFKHTRMRDGRATVIDANTVVISGFGDGDSSSDSQSPAPLAW